MPAVTIDVDGSSNGRSPESVTEKLDDSRAAPSNIAEDSRTNGNGSARQGSEGDASEGDTGTEEEESEDGEDDAREKSLDVGVGHDQGDDGGEEEDEEEDDDDDDDDEEEEPFLKYERMGGAVNDLLKKDSASALAVSNKCLVCPLSKH